MRKFQKNGFKNPRSNFFEGSTKWDRIENSKKLMRANRVVNDLSIDTTYYFYVKRQYVLGKNQRFSFLRKLKKKISKPSKKRKLKTKLILF